ncbi:MAG: ferrous iron transport protein A [Clostridia bacterium]|nr:ferrous iron transport protein A [Clostridia bacterium]
MCQQVRLCDMQPGERAVITSLPPSALRQRLLDMGFLENAEIECVGKSPFGDPNAYLVCGAVVALRRQDCHGILVRKQVAAWD